MLLMSSKNFLSKFGDSKTKISIRKLSNRLTKIQFQEVKIKVPWGTINGKFWGSTNIEPIIAIHGWQDNAASFNPLAVTLPENVSLFAIDLPGHGLSSWIPDGLMYNTLIYMQALHRIKEHYGMDKFGIIGHSLGGAISFYYTSLFPNNVKFAITLDYFKYPSLNATKDFANFSKEWNNYFKYEKLKTLGPSYTEKELIDKWINSTKNSLDESLCRILMERGVTKKSDNTVFFCRDPRTKLFLNDIGLSHNHLIELLAHRINCPYMVIKGKNSHFNESKIFYYNILKIIEKYSQDFQFRTSPGAHHFHMSNSKQVAEIINPFILKYLS